MSLLAPTEPAPVTSSPSLPTPAPDARATFHATLSHVEDAFAVAIQQADARTAAATAQLADLQAKHDALAKAHAELEAKFAVLKELRAKLDAL